MSQPLSLAELKKLRKPAVNVNEKFRDSTSKLDNLALFITNHIGTMGFFLIIFTWTICWLSWNIFAPENLKFDPAPAFVLWLFISNMIQISLMPLLLIGQNLQGKHAEIRSEADYETNIKAEREIEAILQHLENQNKILSEMQEKLIKN